MVALHQPYELHEEPSEVDRARALVDQLQAGLPRALLATPPDVLRSVAGRAARAEVTLQRWERRVGDRPALCLDSAAAVDEAKRRFESLHEMREKVVDQCTRTLVRGNVLALGALGAAGALVAAGGSPMDLPVAVAIVAAPLAPVAAGWMAASRTSVATRDERTARQGWADALEGAGVPTMGALAARRVAVGGWERRKVEAAAVAETARPDLRAWQLLAGPGMPPAEVDALLERIECLRQAQIALLGALLDTRVETQAMAVLAPASEVAEPEAAPSWLADALIRFRSGTLRLWSGGDS